MTGSEYAIQKRRERQREYYRKHRDQKLAYNREYVEKNREKIRAYHTAYMREYRNGVLRKKMPKDEE